MQSPGGMNCRYIRDTLVCVHALYISLLFTCSMTSPSTPHSTLPSSRRQAPMSTLMHTLHPEPQDTVQAQISLTWSPSHRSITNPVAPAYVLPPQASFDPTSPFIAPYQSHTSGATRGFKRSTPSDDIIDFQHPEDADSMFEDDTDNDKDCRLDHKVEDALRVSDDEVG
jgi:hypothetical protein